MRTKHLLLPVLVVLAICMASPAMGQGKTKKQLEKEKSQLEADIKKLNADLAKAKKNTKLTNSQLAALNKKIEQRNKLIDNINGQLSQLDSQISQMNDSINVIKSRRRMLQESYAATVRSLYREYRKIDKWVLLFDTPSYNRALLRTKYFKKYNEYRLRQARAIRQCEDDLVNANNELQRKKDEQNTLLGQEKRHRNELTKEQRMKEASVRQSQADEKKLAKQLSNKESQKRKLQQQIERIIAEEVQRAAAARNKDKKTANTKPANTKTANTKPANTKPTNTANTKPATGTTVTDKTTAAETALSNDFASNKGKLAWPVAYTSIARNYGLYTHESGGQNMNNGIDLVTVQGTNVYAVFKGTVSRTFTCPNGTIGVIIRHGDYMTVYANLATCSVKSGQQVSTRAVIGTVASDGNGHGEFSFQLWKGRESLNPRSWLR